ncbi:type VII secretion-associated serine protease mycosin [Corynebacterium aquatimens]
MIPQAAAQDTACAQPAPVEPPRAPDSLIPLRQIATGKGMRVAVIDTGVSRHPELDQLAPGKDFVTPDEPNPLWDCDGHGTIVAGIIASTTLGVAPDAQIISIRQSSAHFRQRRDEPQDEDAPLAAGTMATLTDAIHDAVDHRAHVINISLVSCVEPALAARVDTRGLAHALRRAEESGALVIAAAGNATSTCPPGSTVYPALFPTVVAVGARADSYTMADYSLPHQRIVSAPGTAPVGLSLTGQGWSHGVAGAHGAVTPFTGTSFATPVVSGTAALLRQRYPKATPAQLREILYASADPNGGAIDPFTALTHVPPWAAERVDERPPLRVRPVTSQQSPTPQRSITVALGLVLAGLICLAGYGLRSLTTSPRQREP